MFEIFAEAGRSVERSRLRSESSRKVRTPTANTSTGFEELKLTKFQELKVSSALRRRRKQKRTVLRCRTAINISERCQPFGKLALVIRVKLFPFRPKERRAF